MAALPLPSEAPAAKKFQFVGGNLALDFTNTVGGKRGATMREYLKDYRDFLSWSQQARLLDTCQLECAQKLAERDPKTASGILVRAIELREALYRIFAALAQDKKPAGADVDRLNSELASALGRMRLTHCAQPAGSSYCWEWSKCEEVLDQPLGPIAYAGADLLTKPELLNSVRRCEGDNCGWLFVDASKNHSRRWCDMRDCGNRAKVRRHRLKQRNHAD